MRSIINESIEVGDQEKHIIEYRYNAWSGAEEVLDNGKSIYSKHMFSFGIDRTFEIGDREKVFVRIKHGFFEWIRCKVQFEVNKEPTVSQKSSESKAVPSSIFWFAPIKDVHAANSATLIAITAAVISILSTLALSVFPSLRPTELSAEAFSWLDLLIMVY